MPVTLTNPNRVTMPSWLTDTSASQGLTSLQAQLPQLFDTAPFLKAGQDYNQSFANRAEMGFDAQARAAQNRAMLSGGRVGASFAKGGLMLGLQNNLNAMNLDYAKLAAQMRAQQAGLQYQTAGALADYGQRHQGQLADWTQGQQGMGMEAQRANQSYSLARQQMARQAMQEAARLKQQGSQFDRNFGFEQQRYNDSRSDAQAAAANAMGSRSSMDRYGYIPSFGPITGAIVNGNYQPNSAYTPESFQMLYNGFRNGSLPIPQSGGSNYRYSRGFNQELEQGPMLDRNALAAAQYSQSRRALQ